MGPLILLFWTSGDVSSGFQSQSGQPYLRLAEAYVLYVPEVIFKQILYGEPSFAQRKCLKIVVNVSTISHSKTRNLIMKLFYRSVGLNPDEKQLNRIKDQINKQCKSMIIKSIKSLMAVISPVLFPGYFTMLLNQTIAFVLQSKAAYQ